jgi:putative SOS response-associated peptidase YedK
MPLMLREKEVERWLGADAGALRPLDLEHVVDELTRHPVASRVNRTEEDDAGLLEEAGTGWLF